MHVPVRYRQQSWPIFPRLSREHAVVLTGLEWLVPQVLRIYDLNGTDVALVAQLILAWYRVVVIFGFDVTGDLLLHAEECLVLKEHVVHELVPLFSPSMTSATYRLIRWSLHRSS